MSPIAQGWTGASRPSMRRTTAHPRYRYGATERLTILLLAVLTVIGSAKATDSDVTLPENGHGRLIAKDDTPSGFSYLLGSFNGLVTDNVGEGPGETRGLDIVTRATTLRNNRFETGEISLGATGQTFSFSPDSTASDSGNDTSKRTNPTVYLSFTICSGPIVNESALNTASELPQPAVYVSTSDREPGPGKDNSDQTVHNSTEGYMSATVTTNSGSVYITVVPPSEGGNFTGSYRYQLAASTDGFFHDVDDHSTFLDHLDSGSETALLTTVYPAGETLTEDWKKKWRNNTAVYNIFVNNANDTAVSGLSRSFCALEEHSQAGKDLNVQTSMARRKHLDNGLQEQFYVSGLNRSSTYMAILGLANSTDSRNGNVGGGGKVWKAKSFPTKSDGNCDIIFGLDFCSETAYAVPSHPSLNMTTLREKYDTYAADLYRNFSYSLQQVQCNTSNETIFSMATSCAHCADAYKTWLCNVTIPQCADYSSTSNLSAVMVRNAGQAFPNGTKINNSTLRNSPLTGKPRNSGLIDKEINPGPYKEILPRVNVCHELVKKCPMSLGFQCPDGKYLPYSYAINAGEALYPVLSVTVTSSLVAVLLRVF